ncbi:glycosyltransferase family 9 protein [Gluconobacter kanchanaburiensis]|uniref:Glycosyl transferase n=1 Tax=Gluconobacter kanchanaburiensis NBRC 103587 TaxID=1307948 RepID=A0A511B7X7_9PROT|nr:glycosyltransferase family 9 protein [Gluconobacter kanchanaburiensis]MBF0862172.1 glycosyltransferase family 9 protein [Gluconobacter kanchanaburiensis]GBR71326.1 lipopolysaccharide heptosyltransferase [Gluconobacter kanchanaburiensis NBRC 103587]GEK96560.1 glycosyl transferase [Gluconobacter kanchanaburiensis NBRC 103587]
MSRILVIKLGALGDIVQAFGAFASIRAAFPHATITLLTTAPFVDLARTAPWFDEIETDARPSLANLPGVWRLSRKLRGYDRIFDLQTSGRSKTYFRLAGCPENWSGISDGCCHPHGNPSRNDMHTLARLDDQLHAAGVTPLPRDVPHWLAGRGPEIASPYAVIVPGAAFHRPQKRWPAPRFAEVASALVGLGLTPVIVGTQAETPLAREIVATCPAARDLTGQTTLVELAGVLDRARIVIGNDTGPMHLAAAMDTPCLTLFGPDSDPRLTAPLALTAGRTDVIVVPDLAMLPTSRVLTCMEEMLSR